MQRLGMLLLCGLLLAACGGDDSGNDDDTDVDVQSVTVRALEDLECPAHAFPVVGFNPGTQDLEWACILAWIPAQGPLELSGQ